MVCVLGSGSLHLCSVSPEDAGQAFRLRGRQRGADAEGAGNEVSGLDGPGGGCEGMWAAAVWKVGASAAARPPPAHHGLLPGFCSSPPSAHIRPAGLHQASSMWQFHPAHQAPFPLWPHGSAECWGATLLPYAPRPRWE